MENNVFNELNSVDVKNHVEVKDVGSQKLSYLSWTWAFHEVLSRYPDTKWEVKLFDGKPYIYDENTGYMVFTTVTINGVTREMWLPVMDGRNNAMLNHTVTSKNSYGKEIVTKAATMFDINKTIMRCLVKNFAVFGLGLNVYAGEDLPLEEASMSLEELVLTLEQYNDIIPTEKKKEIENAIKEKKVSYLQQVLSWCKSKEKK